MSEVKSGEIKTDGKNVVIGAPAIRAIVKTTGLPLTPPPPPKPSESLGIIIRHLTGIVRAADQLQKSMEVLQREIEELEKK